jgi:hypothetical protein
VPWSEKSVMSQRHEFVMLFEQEGVNRRELCRRFGVSPTIGYRLLADGGQGGSGGPLAAPATFAGAPLGGDGRLGAGGARRASRLGWAQDPSPVAGSEAPAFPVFRARSG